MLVTVTDEDGTWSAETSILVGNCDQPVTPVDAPWILSAQAVINADYSASVWVNAIPSLVNPQYGIVSYEWDADGDGIYEEATDGDTRFHQVIPTNDFMPYVMNVRVTDNAGNTDEAVVYFQNGGVPKVEPTINTYDTRFIDETPALKGREGWVIHHPYQVG